METGRIALGLLELLLGSGLIVVSQRMSKHAHIRGGLRLTVHLVLQVLGILLALYGLLQLLFVLV